MTIYPISFCYKLSDPVPQRTYKADESRSATDVFVFTKILEGIDKAIVKGQYYVNMYGNISTNLKVTLIKMGYTVTILHTDNNQGLSSYTVTWF